MAAPKWENPVPNREEHPFPVPYTQVHHVLRRTLETVQDMIVIALMALLTIITVQALRGLLEMALWKQAQPSHLLSQVVYVLILMELYRTLIFYLREHRVSVALMLEVAIVSILQTLILNGIQANDWRQILGSSLLLVVLGGLLALERWLHRTVGGSSDLSSR